MGSGEFGLCSLERLVEEHEVVGVITSPDKPAGRNRKETPTPIGKWSLEHNLQVIKTEDVNSPEILEKIKSLSVDATVVIAFGQKLSEELVELNPIVNLHASLLPRWRGAAPINAAIVHGDKFSGVSVITIAQKMDSGLVLGSVSTEIGSEETAGQLHDRLRKLGPDLILEVLKSDLRGEIQDESKVTYAPKLSRKDSILDLTKDSTEVARTIRGLSPWPCCHLNIAGIDCKIINAIPNKGTGKVGEILADGTIAVGCGSIKILKLKPAGSNEMSWEDFCNGRSVKVGDVCGVQA